MPGGVRSGAQGARRHLVRLWPRFARRAFHLSRRLRMVVVGLAIGLLTAGGARADGVLSAEFFGPTQRYAHGVLGDDVEYSGLRLITDNTSHRSGSPLAQNDLTWRKSEITITLPLDHVFEDLKPRLIDIDLDGGHEVMVVETDVARGAQLAIYDARGRKIAETPHIGRRNRWLAPIGAADLDGDGQVEVAFVDRPHLAKTLRIWRYTDGKLDEVAAMSGVTNHMIGESFITSGIRTCEGTPELVLVDSDWKRIVAVRVLSDGKLLRRDIAPFDASARLHEALNCKD